MCPQTELDSFLIEISALIFAKKDDKEGKEGWLLDQILDKTGMKGTGTPRTLPPARDQRLQRAHLTAGPSVRQSCEQASLPDPGSQAAQHQAAPPCLLSGSHISWCCLGACCWWRANL